jgi:hemerythrin
MVMQTRSHQFPGGKMSNEAEISNQEVFFKWSPDYSVNIKTIDSQHQELVNILNRLFVAVSMREGNSVIASILKALHSYTKTHFDLEERLMQQAQYSDFEAHKREHQILIDQLEVLSKKHLQEEKPIYFEMLRFLKTWLKQHIKGVDTRYSAELHRTSFSLEAWEREATAEFSALIEKTGRWWKLW